MSVSVKQSISGSLFNKGKITGKLGISTSGVTEQYEGDYTVIPKVTAQTLETKKKVMTDDLKITEIPVYEVTNNQGGMTVYIAKE